MMRLISRTVILAFTWWVLTKGAEDSWQIGIPAILSALYVDYRLLRTRANRWSLRGLIGYALYFLKSSVFSGIDVVRRAFHPQLPLKPAIIEYPLELTCAAARNLFACTVSLLPGTLSVALDENRLVAHVLDVDRPFEQELKTIERRVAGIFRPRPQNSGNHLRTD